MAKAKAKPKVVTKKAGKKPAADVDRPKGVEMDFKISDLTHEPAFQPRFGDGKSGHGIYEDHVNDLRRAVRSDKERANIPRVRVWRIAGRGNYLTDGHHTTKAYEAEGRKTVPAEVFEGTWLDAAKDASAANPHKALKPTSEEKRNAVRLLIKALAAEGEVWSNGRIAKHCNVSDDTVAREIERSGLKKPEGPVQGVDGKTYKDPSKKKKPEPKEPKEKKPEPSLGSNFEPKEAGGSGPPNPAVAPTSEPPKPALTFDFSAFEGHVGVLERDIDNLARIFGVMNVPRTEGIRRALRDFKAAFCEWHKELGEKAKVKG